MWCKVVDGKDEVGLVRVTVSVSSVIVCKLDVVSSPVIVSNGNVTPSDAVSTVEDGTVSTTVVVAIGVVVAYTLDVAPSGVVYNVDDSSNVVSCLNVVSKDVTSIVKIVSLEVVDAISYEVVSIVDVVLPVVAFAGDDVTSSVAFVVNVAYSEVVSVVDASLVEIVLECCIYFKC